MTTMEEITFKKTITVYVEQRLTFEEFKKTYHNEGKDMIKAWKILTDKASQFAEINVEDEERDDDDDYYNCDEEIDEMVEEIMEYLDHEEEKKKKKMGSTLKCDTCDTKLVVNYEDKDLKNLCQPCWDKKEEDA
jgi:S-adenosylmethionine synthetase